MELIILGSGGAIPIPRPFCQCPICQKARRKGEPYRRNSSSLFISGIDTVIDCGEDIGDSLNRRDIKQVDNLFITHWHPDHTFGLRLLLESNYDFLANRATKAIDLFIPKRVFEELEQAFPTIGYLINVQKTGILHLLEDGEKVVIKDHCIEVVGYNGRQSDTYAYLIEHAGKRALYAPCDTIDFDSYRGIRNLDLLINECGIFSNCDSEITFDALMARLRQNKPQRTILTHIEEIDVNKWGEQYLEDLRKRYPDIDPEFAYDGMEIVT